MLFFKNLLLFVTMAPNLVQRYLSTISPDHFFFQNFIFLVFLALLCATAQHIYCLHAGVRRPSVRKTCFLGRVQQINTKFGEKVPFHHISRQFLFVFQNFAFLIFYDFFFVFVNTGPYGKKTSNDISPESTHQIHSRNAWILLGRSLPKLYKNSKNFKFWIFAFFSFSLTWDHIGENSSNNISSQSIQHIHSPEFLHTPGEGRYQNCSENCDIPLLGFLSPF